VRCECEIDQNRVKIFVNKDILQLEISVADVFVLEKQKRVADAFEEESSLRFFEDMLLEYKVEKMALWIIMRLDFHCLLVDAKELKDIRVKVLADEFEDFVLTFEVRFFVLFEFLDCYKIAFETLADLAELLS